MKVLFMTFHQLAPQSGISKKIISQVEALRACGITTALCALQTDAAGKRCRVVDAKVIDTFGAGILGKIRSVTAYQATLRHILENNYDALYVRHEYSATPFLTRMLQKLHEGGIKIFVEIPTFPYDGERGKTSLSSQCRRSVDSWCRERMFKHVDRVVTFVDMPKIFGVPTLTISNAVDFSTIAVKEYCPQRQRTFHFVAVAELQPWHGLDRMIRGLAAFKGEKMVLLHIVGGSPGGEEDALKRLAQNLGVTDRVIFHGWLSGEALQRVMHASDFAIASLGRHRCGISKIKTLKNREYAACGLPFAYSEVDEDFEHMPYIIKVPADNSPVDIGRLLDFHAALTLSPQQIRASVESTLSWKVQMQKVADALRL